MAWEYPDNFSNGSSVTSISSMFDYGNYVTGGSFAYGMLLIIFLITSVPFMMANSRKAFAVGFFITFIFSVYFMRIGLISIGTTITLAILTIVTAFLSKGEGTASM